MGATMAAVMDESRVLGVRFSPHTESRRMMLVGWYHNVFNHNPFFQQSTWVTLYPWIYHPEGVTNVWEHWKLVAHELVHFNRQRAVGTATWTARYLTSWKFRWYEERWAYLRDICNKRHTLDSAVDELTGPTYKIKLNPVEMRAWLQVKAEGLAK